MLSGTPDAAGKFDVAVTATIDRQVRKLDDEKLGWGQEVVLLWAGGKGGRRRPTGSSSKWDLKESGRETGCSLCTDHTLRMGTE